MSAEPTVPSPLRWFGGKYYLAARLVDLFPPHRCYGEVFAGGLHVLFRKPQVAIETVNDINGDLMTFWRVLRDPEQFAAFERLCALTPYSRQQFMECREQWPVESDPVQRAWAWFVAVRQSFSGSDAAHGWSFTSQATATAASDRWVSAVDRLPAVHERLRRVQMEAIDFRQFFALYGREDVLLYVDPPYVPTSRIGGDRYRFEMDMADHLELTELLLTTPAMVVLSGYRIPEVHDPLEHAGWQRLDVNVPAWSENAGAQRTRRTESVWRNPAALAACGRRGLFAAMEVG